MWPIELAPSRRATEVDALVALPHRPASACSLMASTAPRNGLPASAGLRREVLFKPRVSFGPKRSCYNR